jgi:hypothetical protein
MEKLTVLRVKASYGRIFIKEAQGDARRRPAKGDNHA